MERSNLAKRAGWLLLIAVGVVYLCGLGGLPFVGPDEPRYAQVAREMFARGDFVTPTLNGRTWFEKPALLYWMMMASFEAFGISEWSARLGSACAGLLTLLLVGWVANAVETATGAQMRWFGVVATATAATMAGLLVFSRGASFDILLTLTVTLALASFFVSELRRDERKRRWLLAGFYVGVGLSLLAKGLVGVVIPFGVAGSYLLLRRRWRDLFRLGLWWGLPLSVAVAALWYAPVIARHGWTFVEQFFVQHHFARYLSDKYHHPQPFYFYIPILALLSLPWTVFLAAGIGSAATTSGHADDAASKLRVFALAWLLVPVLFFSASGSKLPGYILPALAGGALLAGERLARYVRGEGNLRAMRLTGALILLAVGGIIYAVRAGLATPVCALVVALPILLTGALALLQTHKRTLCVAATVCASLAVVALISACGLDGTAERESVRGLLERARERGYSSTHVLQLHTVQRTAEFYAAGRLDYDERGEPVKLEGPTTVQAAAERRGGTALVLVPVEYVWQLTEYPPLEARPVADNGAVAIVFVRVR
ncbi:MAG TPA: glycosyltransferase family 39 protein [Pyrinomonadaceae bacterium]|nr:glycosyltransferase family 39 protein [Pyrinomonadaceae bacterium]